MEKKGPIFDRELKAEIQSMWNSSGLPEGYVAEAIQAFETFYNGEFALMSPETPTELQQNSARDVIKNVLEDAQERMKDGRPLQDLQATV